MQNLFKLLSRYWSLIRSDLAHAIFCTAVAAYIRLVRITSHWEEIGGEVPRWFWQQGQPFVLAFWHGRLLMMPYCWSHSSQIINMLISLHRDGQFISRIVAHFGIRTVAGSSSQGGSTALRAMLRALKFGEAVGITPDGPRGPCSHASMGVVKIARLGRTAVVPVSFSASHSLALKSWDRFLIALPFSRGVFVWGQPILISRNADTSTLEACRQEIERALNIVTAEADRRVGRRHC